MKKNASNQVLDFIKKKLQSGEWTMGMKISTETELMKEAGVGRSAVREAIENLVAMDILTKRQGDGTYVNDLSARPYFNQLMPGLLLNVYDSIEVLEFREAVEPACVQMFIQHYSNELFQSLEKYLSIMEEHRSDQEQADFYQADRDFHLTIAKGCENQILIKVMKILDGVMTSYHYSANKTIGAKTGVEEHRAILGAIQSKDGELASLLMKRHIQRSKRDILEYTREQEEH